MDKEIWKPIKGFEKQYLVSNMGRIKSLNYNRQRIHKCLIPFKNAKDINKAYYLVNFYDDNRKRKNFTVHKLVALHFVEYPKDGKTYEVNHIDGNKHNNKASNLEWVTAKENVQHATKNRLIIKGRHNYSCTKKLNEEKVIEIKKYIKEGLSNSAIGKIYNVHFNTIQRIREGKTWKRVIL